jgi:hypothetical protein
MPPDPKSLLSAVMPELRVFRSYRVPNIYYAAAWTDSWHHRHCLHKHKTLIEAAECAMPNGAAWYIFAIEGTMFRQLTRAEERALNEFRFGPEWAAKQRRDNQ